MSLLLACCVRVLTEATVACWRCHLAQSCAGRVIWLGHVQPAGAARHPGPGLHARAAGQHSHARAQPALRGGDGQRACSA